MLWQCGRFFEAFNFYELWERVVCSKKKNINKNKKRKKKVWDLFCTIMDVIDANIIFWEIGMLCVKFYWRKTTLIDLRTKNYKGMNELDLYTQ